MNGYLEKNPWVKQLENITPTLAQKIVENLNLWEKLILRITGTLHIDDIRLEGWSKELPLYLFKCHIHDYKLNYQHGYDRKLLCLDCMRTQLEKNPCHRS